MKLQVGGDKGCRKFCVCCCSCSTATEWMWREEGGEEGGGGRGREGGGGRRGEGVRRESRKRVRE